jgi:3-hydroxybutyryl-CoA dehydrogenase
MIDTANTTVAVAGAGLMGTGIAHVFAQAGFKTNLFDISKPALKTAKDNIEKNLAGGVKRGKIDEATAAQALKNISLHDGLSDAAQDVDLFVETVSERLDLKQSLICDAEKVAKAGAPIATNTSALSVTEIGTAMADPSRMIGMHFFNPAHIMKLVEIVIGIATSEETISRTRAFSDAIGKSSILVNETPGLTTSRMSAMLGNEAMWMLQEGTASAEDIDTALKLGLNHPMGPLELGDLTGWDTRLSALRYLHSTLGDKFRPCPLIIKMVAAGRYGRKVGHGVYKYEDGKQVPGSGLKGSKLT